ncbi:MAG TPA: response regulator transcription factor [Acidimicrobiales bacterium]|nr:response regulator transcription factor [Acidimicrobiales bacterium]
MISATPVRVLLADDHPVYRLGLSALLGSLDGFEVAGEAASGSEAVSQAATLRPDVVVMDLQMPGMNGIEATRHIVKSQPDVAVLVLTYSDEDHSVLDAVLAGARGYVLKDAGMDAILRAIEDVAAGEMILGPSVAKSLRERLAAGPSEPARPFPELTDRELEVLDLMARGLNNASIALSMHVGDKRVRNIITEIYSKLGVTGRPQAIIVAREAGLGRNPTTTE